MVFFFIQGWLILTYILVLCWLLDNCSSVTAKKKRRMVSFAVLLLKHFVEIFFLSHRTISISKNYEMLLLFLRYKVVVPVSYQRLMYTYSVTILNDIYSFRWIVYGPGVVSAIDTHIRPYFWTKLVALFSYVWSRCTISDWCTHIRP